MNRLQIIALLLILLHPLVGLSDLRTDGVKVVARADCTVTRPEIQIGDIADVESTRAIDDEQVIALKKIRLQQSPSPGKNITISAQAVLDRLREEGVNLNQIRYVLPTTITVRRASRVLGVDEVREALDRYFQAQGKQVVIKSVSLPEDIGVAPGPIQLEANQSAASTPGTAAFSLQAKVPGDRDRFFDVRVSIDQWEEVPVVKRPLSKGSIVSPEDVQMARLNIAGIPRDAARTGEQVVGSEITRELGFGELFRKSDLARPTVIEVGNRVVMIVKSGLLEVTGRGTALQAGAIGDLIQVRNESSKKVISGTVKEAGLVEVHP